jgi:hypothetical protein
VSAAERNSSFAFAKNFLSPSPRMPYISFTQSRDGDRTMKTLTTTVFALALAAFAMPAAAQCSWGKDKVTTEKPEEKVENPSA